MTLPGLSSPHQNVTKLHFPATLAGEEHVHAVVGGWHLAPYPDEIISKTVEAMKEINPDYLIPMHCTGFRTIMAVQREMPQKLIMPSTGTRVVFGA